MERNKDDFLGFVKELSFKSGKIFVKFFTLKVAITLVRQYLFFRKSKYPFNIETVLRNVFSFSNFRTCLLVGLLPFLYLIFDRLIGFVRKERSKLTTFISAFSAAWIAYSVENRSSLFNTIILMLLVRALQAYSKLVLAKFDIHEESRPMLHKYFWHAIACVLFGCAIWCNRYSEANKLYRQITFMDTREKMEFDRQLQITNLLEF